MKLSKLSILTMYISFIFILLVPCVLSGEIKTLSIRKSLAVKILKTTLNSTKNTVVSVLPLQFSFCKLASIAQGKAKEELLMALGFKRYDMINTCYTDFSEMLSIMMRSDLILVNKIYHNYSEDFKSSVNTNSSYMYGVNIDKVGYNRPKKAAAFINRAVSMATYRRVEDVVNEKHINNATSLLFVIAAHIKVNWEQQFDYRLTKPRKFTKMNGGIVEVPMMSTTDSFLYYDAQDYRVLMIKMRNLGGTITFIQPGYRKLDVVLEKLQQNPNLLINARGKSTWTLMKLVLPKLKIKSQHDDITRYLKLIGIKEILSSNTTGLNAMLKQGVNASNIFVSNILQKLFVEVDEFGVSRINRDWPLDVPEIISAPSLTEFILDQPFYFTINLEVSFHDVYELFNGVYYGPEQ